MAAPDPKNAHVRAAAAGRENPEVVQQDADRLLNDPAFIRGAEAMREGLVAQLENMKSDGSPESEQYEREICRALRMRKGLIKAIAAGGQLSELKLAGFRPVATNSED
jgi:hypothetical protein